MRCGKFFGVLMAIIFAGSLPSYGAGERTAAQALGILEGNGSVWLDHQLAPPSTVLFPGEVVRTGHGSTAILRLHSGANVTLAGDGEVVLPAPTEKDSFDLRHGVLLISNGGNGTAQVNVLGVSVTVPGQPLFPALCRIAAIGHDGAIFNDRGVVEVHGRGLPLRVAPGKYIQFEAGAPAPAPQQPQKAGAVSNEIPSETIQRQGHGPAAPLKVSQEVDWNDLVQTLNTGRVRIQLLDGSVLNIGARSQMRIITHNPQTQQTQVEFALGKMRAEVVKLTKPNASFQVRTQTAVIGVVGTTFLIVATPTTTRVTCLQGLVAVQNINPLVVGQVTLQPGQMTTVARGLPPTGAVQAPASQVSAQVNQTNITTTTAPTPVTSVSSTAGVTANAATTAAAGTSAALGGVALSHVNSANSTLTQANNTLQTAANSDNNAVTAANNAAAAAAAAATTTSSILTAVSPSVPVCGCP